MGGSRHARQEAAGAGMNDAGQRRRRTDVILGSMPTAIAAIQAERAATLAGQREAALRAHLAQLTTDLSASIGRAGDLRRRIAACERALTHYGTTAGE